MELRKQETAVFCTVDEASTLCDTCHHRVPQLQQAGLQALLPITQTIDCGYIHRDSGRWILANGTLGMKWFLGFKDICLRTTKEEDIPSSTIGGGGGCSKVTELGNYIKSLVLALTTYQASHYSRKLPSLKEITHWTFLSMMVGVQNYGPWFDVQKAGVLPVVLADFHNGINNLASDDWDYQVGLEGEHLGLEEVNASYSSLWSQGNDMPVSESLIWYKVAVIRVTTEGHPLNQSISENQSLLVCNSGCRWFLHHHNLGPVQGSE
ncbi:hypothetical protein LINPERHAP2_LOCUS26360 [Linum perenne]